MVPKIHSIEEALALFPCTVDQINERANKAIQQSGQDIGTICTIDDSARTFDNTARAIDSAVASFSVTSTALHVIEMVHPDKAMRQAAHHSLIKLNNYYIDTFSQNRKLYAAFKAFMARAKLDRLNNEQVYYLEEMEKAFKRNGLELDNHSHQELKDIQKALSQHALDFDRNIATDNRHITVKKDALQGLTEEFIKELKRETESGLELFILETDYPTVDQVLQYCTVEATRRTLWTAFVNRAYPANKQELDSIIALRNSLARLLGYTSFTEYDLENQTAATIETVEKFLNSLLVRCKKKADTEMTAMLKDMPRSATLTESGMVKPWDYAFIKAHYKKQSFSIDEMAIAEYFPLEHTIDQLLAIYQEFLGLTFEKQPVSNAWDPTIIAIKVLKETKLLGILFLDMFPRDSKYKHACFIDVIPTISHATNFWPAVGIVIVNFPRPTAHKPALLFRNDVITFFHEFGHALHGILGSTELAYFSGTNVKRDFVEMPSQMLEEWMWDEEILTRVSKHYKTGQPLPKELITKILELRNLDIGYFLQRQIFLSFLSLDCFKEGQVKDVMALEKKLYPSTIDRVAFDEHYHFYASFGHLTSYGAKYYGYLWSKVFAVDMFTAIKQEGLLNPTIGSKYISSVLSKGGSRHPYELITAFLGREPNPDAFFKELGV